MNGTTTKRLYWVRRIRYEIDITVNSSDSNQIDIDVTDSNNLNLKLTGGDKGLRLHMLETIYPVGSIYINVGVVTKWYTIRFWNMVSNLEQVEL